MKNIFTPKSKLEKFSVEVYETLHKEFPQTYFVGGMVRNILLNKKFEDIDIATSAKPEQVASILKTSFDIDLSQKKFAVVSARRGSMYVEITSFRKDVYKENNRFPEITLTKSIKNDYLRRDFTVNCLYFDYHNQFVMDPTHKGVIDLKLKILRSVGVVDKKLKEDPLRIIRAWRFMYDYKFSLDDKLQHAINKNRSLLKNISLQRVEKEINKSKLKYNRAQIKKLYTQALDLTLTKVL